jgi:hypothetical protein
MGARAGCIRREQDFAKSPKESWVGAHGAISGTGTVIHSRMGTGNLVPVK